MADKKRNQIRKSMADHSEDALYREVWEEVYTQRIYSFIRNYYKHLIALAILILLSVAVVMVVRHVRQSNLMDVAVRFESAMDMNPQIAQEALLRIANSSRGGMTDLALFRAYQFAMATGDTDAAVQNLNRLISRGATRDFRDLARIQLALLQGDEMSVNDFQRMIAPTMSKRSPFYYTGLLLMAQKFISEDRYSEGLPLLRKITGDRAAPASIAATAEQLIR